MVVEEMCKGSIDKIQQNYWSTHSHNKKGEFLYQLLWGTSETVRKRK